MPRYVTYDDPAVQAEFAESVKADNVANTRRPAPQRRRQLRKEAETAARTETRDAQPAPATGVATQTKDDYLAKIAKYVPAESITAVMLMFAAFKPHSSTAIWLYVAAGSVANVIYLLSIALAAPPTRPRPRWFFYALSLGAFWLWAIATIDAVQKQAQITGDGAQAKQTAILAGAAFLIPALDTILTFLSSSRRN